MRLMIVKLVQVNLVIESASDKDAASGMTASVGEHPFQVRTAFSTTRGIGSNVLPKKLPVYAQFGNLDR